MAINKSTNTTIRPCSHSELAKRYGISWRTLRSWLEPFQDEIGQRVGRLYNAKQIVIIYERLGEPQGAAINTEITGEGQRAG